MSSFRHRALILAAITAALTLQASGRAQATAELRNDLRLLTRTVAALAEEPR